MSVMTEGRTMLPTLGRGQSVTQAVVVPQDTIDNSKAPMVVSLFKPDGTPFLADTAMVFSTMLFVAQDLSDSAFNLLTGGTYPLLYPLTIVIINQANEARNGLYQAQTDAPDTDGPQPMKKIADLPVGDAMVGSVYALGETDVEGAVNAGNLGALTAQGREGGFIFGSVDTGDGRIWGTLYDGARMTDLEERVEALEA